MSVKEGVRRVLRDKTLNTEQRTEAINALIEAASFQSPMALAQQARHERYEPIEVRPGQPNQPGCLRRALRRLCCTQIECCISCGTWGLFITFWVGLFFTAFYYSAHYIVDYYKAKTGGV